MKDEKMNNEIKMNSEKTILDYTYRNVRFSINSMMYYETYNYEQEIMQKKPTKFLALYLYLRKEKCSNFDSLQEYELSSVNYKYGILSKIPFHGGITFFEKSLDNCELKIGCDYNHLSDDPMRFTLSSLERDAIRAIDAVWELGILNKEVKK